MERPRSVQVVRSRSRQTPSTAEHMQHPLVTRHAGRRWQRDTQ